MLSSMSIYFILLYFFVYGFLGWCTEVGFAAFKTHRFVNRGFLNGPICPIYGVGVRYYCSLYSLRCPGNDIGRAYRMGYG